VREDAEQRIVDPVGRTQSQLCQSRVLFVLGELRLELELLLIQFAIFVEAAINLFLRLIALNAPTAASVLSPALELRKPVPIQSAAAATR
jgi:hypothetical protein